MKKQLSQMVYQDALTKKIVQAVADGIRIGINSKYVKKMVRDYLTKKWKRLSLSMPTR